MPNATQESAPHGYKAPAVHKAFQLLRTVAESQRSFGIVELAERLGYSKSTTHGIVHALLREGALTQGANARKLFLGPAVADLVFSDWNHVQVNRWAQPILNDIQARSEETVFLGVRIRRRVLIVATAGASGALTISAPVGTAIPLLAGAVGKVLLSGEAPQRVRQLVGDKGLPRYTPRSILEMDAYLAELERVRVRGYAVDMEEYIEGVRAVAVALGNQRGLPAAVWVVGMSSSMGRAKIEEVVAITTAAAQTLCLKMDRER